MPWLTTEGASHQIADGETIVGSGAQASWRLPRHDLAARHFVIDRRASRITIRSCGVDNVVAINGAQVGASPHDLKDGDVIDAGSARFLYSAERSGSYPAVVVGPAHLVESRTGIAHDLAGPAVGIGRDRLNAVSLRDPTASRFHAEIRREAGGYVIHPQGSSGTLVNGRRVGSPTRLNDGDRIAIAKVELRFAVGPRPPGSPAAPRIENDETSQRPTVEQPEATLVPGLDRSRAKPLLWLIAAVILAAIVFFAFR